MKTSTFPALISGLVLFLVFSRPVDAQKLLKPGFEKDLYLEFLHLHGGLYDSMGVTAPSPPQFSKLVYRSEVVGLDNRWDLWKTNTGLMVINLRGTTKNPVGWLENFYAAMVPATGQLKLTKDFTFEYKLADNPRAAVHVGFLIGVAFLSGDIVSKIDSCYKTGTSEFLIAGHSQGGALSFLLTAYLHHLQKAGKMAKDIRFKTFASAAPKAGNSFFAYEYENLAAGGWAYNVVNAADWVPEVPFSVQTVDDFNTTNPFKDVDKVVKKQKFFARIALRHGYKQLKKPSEKARRKYEKYLGGYVGKLIRKTLPDMEIPEFAKTSNYVRIGPTIMLVPDEAYFKKYPEVGQHVFVHHGLDPYILLVEKSGY